MKLVQLIGLTTATVLMSVNLASSQETQISDLIIQNPTIRATPPKARVSGGYLIIENIGKIPDRLTGGSVSFAGKVEVHQMKMENSIMKMRHLSNGLQIPAGGKVVLKPGGYHIMFKKLRQQMKAGESHSVTLTFESAGDVTLDFKVEPLMHLNKKTDHSKHGSIKK